MRKILKATVGWRQKGFFFRKLIFPTLTSYNSKVHYAIALKFLAKQINLVTNKSVSAIFEIININADFRISVIPSHSVFLNKYWNTNKTKTKFFLKNRGRTFVENAMILTCEKIQRKVLMFGKVGAPESSSWDKKLHDY